MGFPGGTVVKNLPANEGDARDADSIPRLGRAPGGRHGNPLQYSCLENPMDRETWWLLSIVLQRVQHNLSDLARFRHRTLWRKKCGRREVLVHCCSLPLAIFPALLPSTNIWWSVPVNQGPGSWLDLGSKETWLPGFKVQPFCWGTVHRGTANQDSGWWVLLTGIGDP